MPFIFRDLGRRAILFQGSGERAKIGGIREQRPEEKHFWDLGRKVMFLSRSREPTLLVGPQLRLNVLLQNGGYE